MWPKGGGNRAEIWAKKRFLFAGQSSKYVIKNIKINRISKFTFFGDRRHAFCHSSRTMSVRIDHIRTGTINVVHIAGHLSGAAVTHFTDTCDLIQGPLAIDLSELLFADDEGINAIKAVVETGATLLDVSPFVTLLLEDFGHAEHTGANRNPDEWFKKHAPD